MGAGLIQLLSSALFTVLFVYFIVPLLIRVAFHKNLYDKPDGERKIHDRFIPSLGGIALFVAVFLGFSLSGFAELVPGYPYVAAALVMLFFTGLKDDIVGLSPVKKLVVELSAALMVIYGSGFLIDNLYGIFGIGALPGWAAVPLTVFTIIVVMNAFNLIDGIDGLAAGIGVLASLFFGVVFWISGVPAMAVLALFTALTLSGFLVHNFHPASIFMGDSGSLVIGFLVAVLAVNFVGLGSNSTFVSYFGNTSPVLPAVFLVIPLYDTLRVFAKRAYEKRSPFSPGTDHIHHVLLGCGLSHAGAALYLYAAMLVVAMFALSFIWLDPHMVLLAGGIATLLLLPTYSFKRSLMCKIGIEIISRDLVIKEPTQDETITKEDKQVEEAVH